MIATTRSLLFLAYLLLTAGCSEERRPKAYLDDMWAEEGVVRCLLQCSGLRTGVAVTSIEEENGAMDIPFLTLPAKLADENLPLLCNLRHPRAGTSRFAILLSYKDAPADRLVVEVALDDKPIPE